VYTTSTISSYMYMFDRSNDANELPASADYVRSQGITTLAVGVGEAEPNELKASCVKKYRVSMSLSG